MGIAGAALLSLLEALESSPSFTKGHWCRSAEAFVISQRLEMPVRKKCYTFQPALCRANIKFLPTDVFLGTLVQLLQIFQQLSAPQADRFPPSRGTEVYS